MNFKTKSMTSISTKDITHFQHFILNWHAKYGRHDLPWRTTYDPYHILVSEVMLQQTQVTRVIPKFSNFLQLFPDFISLAKAAPNEIIIAWQGLGYNRRGLYLQKTAQSIIANHHGIMPETLEKLIHLPGVGPYTASAIMAFAFNQPVTVIETNIRSIFLYHFFADGIKVSAKDSTNEDLITVVTKKSEITNQTKLDDSTEKISDSDLLPLITKTIYKNNPRLWYSALMDYGSYLKSITPNPSRKSKEHTKQSKFSGSFRQLRGALLRTLTQPTSKPLANSSTPSTEQNYSFLTLAESVPSIFSQKEVQLALDILVKEGFISNNSKIYSLKRNHD